MREVDECSRYFTKQVGSWLHNVGEQYKVNMQGPGSKITKNFKVARAEY